MPLTTYDDLLVRVRTLIAALPRPPVVAIAGHGGAGKSTLALRLAADLGVDGDQVVGTDGLYARTDTERATMWELHDWPALADLLAGVRSDPTPRRLSYRYRWFDGQEGEVDEPMPPVVIVEGIRVIPFVASALGLSSPPFSLLLALVLITTAYIVAAEATKRVFYRRATASETPKPRPAPTVPRQHRHLEHLAREHGHRRTPRTWA